MDDADRAEERKIEGQRESEKRERERETVQEDEKEELGRVGMGGWLNFSSDHVEPIKADHGTQPPPPTSSTFFVLSLFLPRVLAFIHPPLRGERERGKEKERSLSRMPFPSRSRASPLSTTPRSRPDPSRARVLLPPRLPPLASSTHSLWQLVGFFRVTRRCNLFGRGREAPAEVVDEASQGVGLPWRGDTRAAAGE